MRKAALCLLLSVSVAGAKPNRVLHDFGNEPGLQVLCEDFVGYLVRDKRIAKRFKDTDTERLTQNLYKQFCELLGGDCVYRGRSMKEAHTGMRLNTADFNALVEDLQRAMDQHKVPFASQNKLLSKLAPMWRDVVERR